MTLSRLVLFGLPLLVACGVGPGTNQCIPGQTNQCLCLGGTSGVQLCAADGTYQPCQCTGGGAGGGNGTGGGPPGAGHAPIFLSSGTNVASLTVREAVIFSAVVSDPDGNQDLVGGILRSPDGGIQYGAFATGAEKGAYQLMLTWEQINQTLPISFVEQENREYVAEFFDVAGHSVQRSFSIRLNCDWGPRAACGGTCMDLRSDASNCGGCGHDCRSLASDATCTASVCRLAFHQTSFATTDPVSCNDVCATANAGGHRYACDAPPLPVATYLCGPSSYGENCHCNDSIGYVNAGTTWTSSGSCATPNPTYISCTSTAGPNKPMLLKDLSCECRVTGW